MISHYDCGEKHNLSQYILLNVKPCTETPSIIQHAKVRARVNVRAKVKRFKAFKCEAYAKKERKFVFEVQFSTDALIEPYGTIIHYLCRTLLTH